MPQPSYPSRQGSLNQPKPGSRFAGKWFDPFAHGTNQLREIFNRPTPGGMAGNWNQQAVAGQVQPPQTPGENAYPAGGPGGGSGGGGGPSAAEINALANSLFKFNAGPYNAMRQQAQGYNPDFAGMEAQANQRSRAIDQQRAASITARLNALVGFGGQLAQSAGAGQARALTDMGNQGANAQQYMQMTSQANADRTGMLANQGQYMGQLNAQGSNELADSLRNASMIRQGGEASLANNRGTLLNQLQLQQMQEQQRLEQAKREFMLKYGSV